MGAICRDAAKGRAAAGPGAEGRAGSIAAPRDDAATEDGTPPGRLFPGEVRQGHPQHVRRRLGPTAKRRLPDGRERQGRIDARRPVASGSVAAGVFRGGASWDAVYVIILTRPQRKQGIVCKPLLALRASVHYTSWNSTTKSRTRRPFCNRAGPAN